MKNLSLFACLFYLMSFVMGKALEFSHSTGIYTNSQITVSLTATQFARIHYTVDGTIPGLQSPLYSNPLTISTSVLIKARAYLNNLPISQLVSRTYVMADSDLQKFNSPLPIVVINTFGRDIPAEVPPGGQRRNGAITVIDRHSNRANLHDTADYSGTAALERIGNSSAGMPQFPLRIELQDETFTDRRVPLLGMPAESDWQLKATYSDKSLLNEFLSFEMYKQMGHYQPRHKLVEVFLDRSGGRLRLSEDYFGVMLFTEKIEVGEDRVNIDNLYTNDLAFPAITGGYIFKKDKDSAGDSNFSTSGGGGFVGQNLKLHEPKPNSLRSNLPSGPLSPEGSAQVSYLRDYLTSMEQSLYSPDWLSRSGTNHFSNFIDVDTWVDYFWIVEYPKNVDGYRLSRFWHKDRLGKIKSGPIWDWDHSFGDIDYLRGGWTNGWYYELISESEHPWMRRLISGTANPLTTEGDPDFNQKIADRWGELRHLFGTNLVRRIDEVSLAIEEAATRHHNRWGRLGSYDWPQPNGTGEGRDVDYVTPTRYRGGITNSIIGQMQKFMLGRYLWVDSQFVKGPEIKVLSDLSLAEIKGEPHSTIYYTIDGTDPRLTGGGVSSSARSMQELAVVHLDSNVHIVARARKSGSWMNTWSAPVTLNITPTLPALRIHEIMYNAPSGRYYDYLSLKNVGSESLQLKNYRLRGSVSFDFPELSLNPGEVVYLRSSSLPLAPSLEFLGQFSGDLPNSQGTLRLITPTGQTIQSITYNDRWHPATDGFGFALLPVIDDSRERNSAGDWVPGFRGVKVNSQPVVINEVLANPASGSVDAVEFYNPTEADINLNEWFLTDDFRSPFKYVLRNLIVPARGYATLNAQDWGFGLGVDGDEIWLFSGEEDEELFGYAHGWEFGASPRGFTLGAHQLSNGETKLVLQSAVTLGSPNAGPFKSPIQVTEILAHPAETSLFFGVMFDNPALEFIELRNTSDAPVSLFNTNFPSQTWRIEGSVSFAFPTNVVLQPGEHILVGNFTNLSRLNGTPSIPQPPANVRVFGPWFGSLPNHAGSVRLLAPIEAPTGNYFVIEDIAYKSELPWPIDQGLGLSLQKPHEQAYGGEPTNWVAWIATPGRVYSTEPPAQIISIIPDQVIPRGATLRLNMEVESATQPQFQWRLNGSIITGQTRSNLVVTNVSLVHEGLYDTIVYSQGGITISPLTRVTIRTPLMVTNPPVRHISRPGPTNFLFDIRAEGSGQLSYQWLLNGSEIPGATNASYIFTNVTIGMEGTYSARVTDTWTIGPSNGVDTITYNAGTLDLLIDPEFQLQPLDQTATEGGTAVFLVSSTGSFPMSYRWRTNRSTIAPFSPGIIISNRSYSYLVLSNVQAGVITNVDVVVSNAAHNGLLSARANLTVLADTDRDGLPDTWETARNGFNPNDPTDGLLDSDSDSMNNRAEYIAGTDYLNPSSNLRLQSIAGSGAIAFEAIANKSYTIQVTDSLTNPHWRKHMDIFPEASTRPVAISIPTQSQLRFYRIVTPLVP